MIFRSAGAQYALEEHQFFKYDCTAELLIHLFDYIVISLLILQASLPAQGKMPPEWLFCYRDTTHLKYTVHLKL